MSLSIFDVDGVDFEYVDDDKVKTFEKYCGDEAFPYLKIKVGGSCKELGDQDASVYLKITRTNKNAPGWVVKCDDRGHCLELVFRGWEKHKAIIQALEFAADVLREVRDRVMFQKEEKTF